MNLATTFVPRAPCSSGLQYPIALALALLTPLAFLGSATGQDGPAPDPTRKQLTEADLFDSIRTTGPLTKAARSVFGLRTMRSKLYSRGGWARTAAEAMELGLDWLVANQEADGHWSKDGRHRARAPLAPADDGQRVAATSAALLALLSDANYPGSGVYSRSVRRGLTWLCKRQRPDGTFVDPPHEGRWVLHHAWATLALVEAAAISEAGRLKPFAVRALRKLLAAQHRGCWPMRGPDRDEGGLATGWAGTATILGYRFGLLEPVAGTRAGDPLKSLGLAATDSIAARVLLPALEGRQPPAEAVQHLFEHVARLQRCDDLAVDILVLRAVYQVGAREVSSLLQRSKLADAQVIKRGDPARGSWPAKSTPGFDGSRVETTALSILALETQFSLIKQIPGK